MLFGNAEMAARVTFGDAADGDLAEAGDERERGRPASVIDLHPSNDTSSSELILLNISRLRSVICV
jgi:hypothetical protein